MLVDAGVEVADPSRLDIRGEAMIAPGVKIDINVIMEGKVVIGANAVIGPNCYLRDCEIAAEAEVRANSLVEEAILGEKSIVGPFARLRPGTELAAEAVVGNFVELKKTYLGQGSKACHLSYLGDSLIGSQVNIGAGTITCNYNGVAKFQTEIGDGAFIGSNSALVAPIKIGADALIGAGSVVTADAPPHKLTIARAKQVTVDKRKKEG